jgi:hypothetical protein
MYNHMEMASELHALTSFSPGKDLETRIEETAGPV